MTAQIIPINRHEIDVWDDFVTKRDIAQASGKIEDGREAGRAWRRWLDLSMTCEQREILDGKKVVRL